MFWFENSLLILVAIVSIAFNKQFATLCMKTQKSLWNLDYPLLSFRVPIYIVGGVFAAIAIGRIAF
jgi:hypothetical protein